MYGQTRHRSSGTFFVLCAAMVVIAVASQQPWAAGPRGAAKSVLAPLEVSMTAAASAVGRVTSVMGDISSLRADNDRLRAADAALRRQVVELSAAANENAALRQALNLERSSSHTMVAAQVVGHGPDGLSRTIEVDRGAVDGLKSGMVVVTPAGLLGRLGEVGPHVAIVQTLADSQDRVGVYLVKSGLQGVVSGGDNGLQLSLQSQIGVFASPGEWAMTSGTDHAYPRGLVVGEVASLSGSSGSVAWVNDPSNLDLVLVITDFTP